MPEEFAAALRRLKQEKSPALDSIFPKIWRRALVVAMPSQRRHWGTQRAIVSYVCCVSPLKILERLTYARFETIIDQLLPHEQAGFCHGRSTVDQVTLLTQDIDDIFSARKKAGAVFVDLTAAY